MISMPHDTDQNRQYPNPRKRKSGSAKHPKTSDIGPHVRRDHKDRLFCDLFSDKQNALSLFNAINGTDYSDTDALEIITLKDVVYLTMHNDLAVCIYGQMGLFEQQSTINPNMPLRGLLYFAREYEGWLAKNQKDIYGKALVRIPAPQYYVLYNGTENAPEQITYRLSDAFTSPVEGYEWTVRVLNINPGNNLELMEKCEPLKGYMTLITLIRHEQAAGKEITEAAAAAIDTCIEKNILRDYLIKHKAEVTGMILTEYNEKLHEQTLRKEGREEGIEEGFIKGRREGLEAGIEEGLIKGREKEQKKMAESVRNLMNNLNVSAEEAMELLGLSEEDREQYRGLL